MRRVWDTDDMTIPRCFVFVVEWKQGHWVIVLIDPIPKAYHRKSNHLSRDRVVRLACLCKRLKLYKLANYPQNKNLITVKFVVRNSVVQLRKSCRYLGADAVNNENLHATTNV